MMNKYNNNDVAPLAYDMTAYRIYYAILYIYASINGTNVVP